MANKKVSGKEKHYEKVILQLRKDYNKVRDRMYDFLNDLEALKLEHEKLKKEYRKKSMECEILKKTSELSDEDLKVMIKNERGIGNLHSFLNMASEAGRY